MEKKFNINGEEIKVQDFKHNGDILTFVFKGRLYSFHLLGHDGKDLIIDGHSRFRASISEANKAGESMIIAAGREAVVMTTAKKLKKANAHAGGLTSPMPGKIFKVVKEQGSMVKKGDTILVLEAMKMEHSIRADKDGTVKKINYKVGDLVQGGVILAELE